MCHLERQAAHGSWKCNRRLADVLTSGKRLWSSFYAANPCRCTFAKRTRRYARAFQVRPHAMQAELRVSTANSVGDNGGESCGQEVYVKGRNHWSRFDSSILWKPRCTRDVCGELAHSTFPALTSPRTYWMNYILIAIQLIGELYRAGKSWIT